MAGLSRGIQLGVRANVRGHLRRHFAVTSTASAQAKLDPIQKLFVDKIQEYKKMSAAGKIPGFDEKELQDQLDRVKSAYGAHREDFEKFPTLQFTDPELELARYEGAEKVDFDTLEMDQDEIDTGLPGDHGYGFLRKDLWEKEYMAKHERAGAFEKLKFL